MNEFEIFDIDLQTGSLFVKGIDKLNWETIRTVQIVARDKLGLEDTLNITVLPWKHFVVDKTLHFTYPWF